MDYEYGSIPYSSNLYNILGQGMVLQVIENNLSVKSKIIDRLRYLKSF